MIPKQIMEPNIVLALDSLGMALVVFSIAQTSAHIAMLREFFLETQPEGHPVPKKNLHSQPLLDQLNHLRSKLLFYRFCQTVGTGYFLSALTIAFAFLSTEHNVVLCNCAALLGITPTVLISLAYVTHRLARGKLLDICFCLRRIKHFLID